MSTFGSCALCGKELFEGDQIYMQVVGYVPVRRGRSKSGGTLLVRRETGASAHASCAMEHDNKLKRGIQVTQTGLF